MSKLSFSSWPSGLKWTVGILAAIVGAVVVSFVGYYVLLGGIAAGVVIGALWIPMLLGIVATGGTMSYFARKRGADLKGTTVSFGKGLLWGLGGMVVLTIIGAVITLATGT